MAPTPMNSPALMPSIFAFLDGQDRALFGEIYLHVAGLGLEHDGRAINADDGSRETLGLRRLREGGRGGERQSQYNRATRYFAGIFIGILP